MFAPEPLPPQEQKKGVERGAEQRSETLLVAPGLLCACGKILQQRNTDAYSSFAIIVIFAFSTFDTGHPFSAASAYF
jgi:hypothetical protein